MAKSIYLTLAEKAEPRIRKALIEAWNKLRTQESRAAIERALRQGGAQAVIDLYKDMDIKLAGILEESLNEAIVAGSKATASALPAGVILAPDHYFDIFNPHTIQYIQNYKLGLISNITSKSLEAIRNLLFRDIQAGVNPITTARAIKNTIGLTPNQERAVRNYQEYLETLDNQALQRALRDKRFDRTIMRAIKDGKPLTKAQIERMVNRYRERYIQYRSRVIARTESLRAVHIGNDQNIRQMIALGDIDKERVRKLWLYTHDELTRMVHRKIPGMNPKEGVKLDDKFKTELGPLRFPLDPAGSAANTVQCRCSLRYKILPPQEEELA